MLYWFLLYYVVGIYISANHKFLKKRNQIVMCLLPALFISAFRNIAVGNDTYVYSRAYDLLNTNQGLIQLIKESRFEIGYVTIEYLFKSLGLSYYAMQVVLCCFVYYSLSRFIYKYSKNVWVSSFVFLTTRDMFGPMNTIRMWLAIAILLYSVRFIIERKPVKFILIVLLATSFHFTAIVFVVAYFLYKYQAGFKLTTIVLTASVAILVIARPFFTWITRSINRYGGYLNTVYFGSDRNIAVFIELALNIVFLILLSVERRKKVSVNENEAQMYHLSYIAALLSVALSVIGLSNSIMSRISSFYSVFLLASLPNALSRIKNKNNRVIIMGLFIVLMSLQYLIVIIFRPNWSGIIPYSFMWN